MGKILIALAPSIVLAIVLLWALIYDLLHGRKCSKEAWKETACDFTADLGTIQTYYHTDPDGYVVAPYRIWHQESDTFIRVDYRNLRKYNKWRKELEDDRRTKADNERQREDIEAQLKFTQDVVQKAVDRKKQEAADMVKPLVASWENTFKGKVTETKEDYSCIKLHDAPPAPNPETSDLDSFIKEAIDKLYEVEPEQPEHVGGDGGSSNAPARSTLCQFNDYVRLKSRLRLQPKNSQWSERINSIQNREGSIVDVSVDNRVVPHMFFNGEWVPLQDLLIESKQPTKVKPRKVVKS